jgi:catalase
VHNNQRDGMHRQAINRGRVAYEPNSLGGGCPFQAGARGFTSFPERITADKVRGKPEKFADHFTQAALFYNSQTPVEKAHIRGASRFELTKVTVPAVRERVVSMLANVSPELAEPLAADLGMEMPDAMPRAARAAKPEVTVSPALSLMARPGDGKIRGRHIAILMADGVDGAAAGAVHAGLAALGAVARFVGPRLGTVTSKEGEAIAIEVTLETTPSVLYDAVVIPGGGDAVATLSTLGQALDFVKDQYRHGKSILALNDGAELLSRAGIPPRLPGGGEDPGLLVMKGNDTKKSVKLFAEAVAKHRHPQRETDPPAV